MLMALPFLALLNVPQFINLGLRHSQQMPRELGQSFKRRPLRLTVRRASSSRVLGGLHVVASAPVSA